MTFNTIPLLSCFTKDSLPYLQNSSVIYEFKCRFEDDYVGRTNLRLETRFGGAGKSNRLTQLGRESVIGINLLNNQSCDSEYVQGAAQASVA